MCWARVHVFPFGYYYSCYLFGTVSPDQPCQLNPGGSFIKEKGPELVSKGLSGEEVPVSTAQIGDWRDSRGDQSSSSGTGLTEGDRTGLTGITETTIGSSASRLSSATNESGVEKSAVPESGDLGRCLFNFLCGLWLLILLV